MNKYLGGVWMYKQNQLKNYDDKLEPQQIYFILRWGEIFENSPLSYRKLYLPCSRALIKETLNIVELFEQNVLLEYNVNMIIKELYNAFKKDKILRTYFEKELIHMLHCLEIVQKTDGDEKAAQIKLVTTLLQAFLHKLENSNLINYYTRFLKQQFQSYVSYNKIDEFLFSLASELMYEGHSHFYLYRWGIGVFLRDKEGSFINRLDRLCDLGKKNSRSFEVILKLSLPIKQEFYYTSGPVQFFRDVNGEKQRLNGLLPDQDCVSFFEWDNQLAKLTLQATDSVSGANMAREKLGSLTKLFNLDRNLGKYDPGILKSVLVHDINGRRIYEENTDVQTEGLQLSNINEQIKILVLGHPDDQYQGLDRLSQWCRVVQDSPRETGLVAMWSMLEFLFVHDYTDKRQSVLKYSVPYIAHYFTKSIISRARWVLLNNANRDKFLDEVKCKLGPNALDKNEVKLHYFLEFLTRFKDETLNIYDGEILEQRYINLVKLFIDLRGNGKNSYVWLSKYIRDLEEQIHCDLNRAYRLRNRLAHQATVHEDFFEDIYRKMAFYLKIILEDLTHSMFLQPKHSLKQLVEVKRESYLEYIRMVDGLHKEAPDFKEIVQIKSLYI